MFVQLADYRTSYYYCSSQPLGIENKAIRDNAFNFSHLPQGYPGHSPSVRLASDGGWCPLSSKDSFVFVRVSFEAVHIICAIGLQGDAKNIGFVSKYKLKLAIEDSGEEFYRERGEIKVSAPIKRKTLHSIRKRLNFLELTFRQRTVLRGGRPCFLVKEWRTIPLGVLVRVLFGLGFSYCCCMTKLLNLHIRERKKKRKKCSGWLKR